MDNLLCKRFARASHLLNLLRQQAQQADGHVIIKHGSPQWDAVSLAEILMDSLSRSCDTAEHMIWKSLDS
jgi:hypothetical protein